MLSILKIKTNILSKKKSEREKRTIKNVDDLGLNRKKNSFTFPRSKSLKLIDNNKRKKNT